MLSTVVRFTKKIFLTVLGKYALYREIGMYGVRKLTYTLHFHTVNSQWLN